MITLYQFPRMMGLPNPSAFCIKVETLLRMGDIPYEIVFENNPAKGPKGKFPAIKDGEQFIGDSSLIYKHLQQQHGLNLDEHLSGEQQAVAHAFSKLLEEHLYWPILYSRWQDPNHSHHTKTAFKATMPAFIFPLIWRIASKSTIKQIHAQGTGRHSSEEIYQFGCDAVEAVATYLDDKPYFMGDKVSAIDATIFAFIVLLLDAPHQDPMSLLARQKENLIAYCEKLKAAYFSDLS